MSGTANERARSCARLVAEHVGRVAPAGLGHWPEAWALVSMPGDLFLDALARWESDGAPFPVPDYVRTAGNEFVAAWREAARRWDAAGRPETRSPAGAGR